MANLQNTKRRIKSVDSTKKITKAMELVASAKLRKAKNEYEETRQVRQLTVDNMQSVIAEISKQFGYDHYISKKGDKTLYVIIGGDMGLTGGYNINLAKDAYNHAKKEDLFLCYGNKPKIFLKSKNAHIVDTHEMLVKYYGKDAKDIREINKFTTTYDLAKLIKLMYDHNEIDAVKLVYTQFINSVTFQPKIVDLLPAENKLGQLMSPFEVSGDVSVLLNDLIQDYLASNIFTALKEGKVCEYASSRLAMENATDNAEELKEQLLLEYNRARQANITQEISEIVAGSDAL